MYIAYTIYLIVLCSPSIGIKMYLIDIYVSFGILIECTSYDLLFTPYLHHLCFRQKGGEQFFKPFVVSLIRTKREEGFGFICIFLYTFIKKKKEKVLFI